jgi:hypothetical protein
VHEDPQDEEVGRDEFGDEPLVAVGGFVQLPPTVRAELEGQVERLVEVIRGRTGVGRVPGLPAGMTSLRSGLGRDGGMVELLGGRSGHVERGGVVLESVQFPPTLLEFLAQPLLLALHLLNLPVEAFIVGFELVQSPEDLESLFPGEGDGAVIFRGEKKP